MENNSTATIALDARTVDPATLDIEANIRSNADAAITPALQDSITEYGVRSPITVVERDGKLFVRDGQLRTLAAQRAGLTSVPVLVVPATAGTADEATIERIREQWVHNEHRAAMTDRDRATALRQLSLAGMSATKIAKTTKTSKKHVDKALAAASSDRALSALDQGLTLDQAAILAQYEDDTEATEMLLSAATEGASRFDWAAQWLADNAEDRALIAKARQPYDEAGIAVATTRQALHQSNGHALHSVVTDAGEAVENIEDIPVEHRLVYLYVVGGEECWLDADGNPVDEYEVDWSVADGEADQTVTDGMIDPRTLTEGKTEPTVAIDWWVRNVDTLDGHMTRWGYRAERGTPAQAQDEAAIAEQKEQQREERRRVRELNKLGHTANTVRRTKLREIFSRKTLPKGSAAKVAGFIATTMVRHHVLLGINRQQGSADGLTQEFLSDTKPLDVIDGATAERIQIVNLAVAAGAYEAQLPKDAWRSGWYGPAVASWLQFLVDVFGYELSDIEKVITGDLKAEAVDLD